MRVALALLCLLAPLIGCAGPGPRYADVADSRRRADFQQTAAPAGSLLLVLDSIPYDMVREARDAGRFSDFQPPVRVISPFPVMTDLCLADFFHAGPCPGAESAYVNDGRLTDAPSVYLAGGNMPWLEHVDYDLDRLLHPFAYRDPPAWFDHELGRIQRRARETLQAGGTYVGYLVGTSAWGSRSGRNGHQAALIRLDRFCRAMWEEHGPALRITLMSDHGHKLGEARRIDLQTLLAKVGYRPVRGITADHDVIVPAWGNVSYAAVHTRFPARVAGDLLGFEGVEFAMHVDGDAVRVLSRDGEARISPCKGGWRYVTLRGDPVRLLSMTREYGDCLPDETLLHAARGDDPHPLPDAPRRIWRAFHELIENPPEVMVTFEPGWFHGSAAIARFISMRGVHGNLSPESTFGFCMTSDGELPDPIRMDDLAAALAAMNIAD